MPQVYAIDGVVPVVDPSAFVHPSAVLIGDVIVAAHAYIGPCASLRGDFGRIVVEEGANIQDHCTMHGFPGKDTVAGAESIIGHGAILHGCLIHRAALTRAVPAAGLARLSHKASVRPGATFLHTR